MLFCDTKLTVWIPLSSSSNSKVMKVLLIPSLASFANMRFAILQDMGNFLDVHNLHGIIIRMVTIVDLGVQVEALSASLTCD